MSSYIVFNIVFIIVSLLYMEVEPHIKKNQRKYVVFILLVSFSIMMAIRPEGTKDTLVYINSFKMIDSSLLSDINLLQKHQGYEWGYIYLVIIFKYFSSNYRLLFFLVAFTGTSFAVAGLKKICDMTEEKNNDYLGTVFAIYVSNFGLLYNGISVRAGLAMGMGVFAISLLLQKKYVKGSVLFFLAFTLQRSAILFLVIYLIIRFMPVLRKKTYWVLWCTAGITLFSQISVKAYYLLSSSLLSIIYKFNISGYAAFFMDSYLSVGLRDIYLWLLFGLLILLMSKEEKYGKYLNVVMVGAFVVVTMYGVRAVARAYDIFYLFMVPCLSAIYWERTVTSYFDKRLITYAVIIANSILMLRLCFI